MRSRPEVQVRLRPPKIVAGTASALEVQALFESKSETPVERVSFRLRGLLLFLPTYENRVFYDQQAEWPGKTFTVGTHEYAGLFQLPDTLPPSFAGTQLRISYELEVNVEIPWWPDLQKFFGVELRCPSVSVQRPNTVFTSWSGELAGTEPKAECTLERSTFSPGDVVRGTVSLQNIKANSTLFVNILRRERRHGVEHSGELYETKPYKGALVAGETIPFAIRLPKPIPCTFSHQEGGCSWSIEIAVQELFQRRSLMKIPITIAPVVEGVTEEESRSFRVPAVGRQRRVQLWAYLAKELGLTYDVEEDCLRASVGAIALEVVAEQRDGEPCTVATLRWPSVGIGLQGRPATRLGGFLAGSRRVRLPERFDAALQINAQRLTLAREFLPDPVLSLLVELDRFELNDEGLDMVLPGAGFDLDLLRLRVRSLLSLAQLLDVSAKALPLPLVVREREASWMALAAGLQGFLVRGSASVLQGNVRGTHVQVSTVWNEEEQPVHTEVRALFDQPYDTPPEPPTAVDPLRDRLGFQGKIAFDRVVRAGTLDVTNRRAKLVIKGSPEDPSMLQGVTEALASVVQELQGRVAMGPFR